MSTKARFLHLVWFAIRSDIHPIAKRNPHGIIARIWVAFLVAYITALDPTLAS